jgi:hypothetical protein
VEIQDGEVRLGNSALRAAMRQHYAGTGVLIEEPIGNTLWPVEPMSAAAVAWLREELRRVEAEDLPART